MGVLRETEYLDTSGLNDYDSLSSLPGVGPGSGLPSTPQHRNVSNLAIPSGGIDADIGDTSSVQSWCFCPLCAPKKSNILNYESHYGLTFFSTVIYRSQSGLGKPSFFTTLPSIT